MRTNDETDPAQTLLDEIEEHKKAVEELRQSHEQQEVILRGIADGIALHGPDGQMTYANDALARMIGFPSAREMLAATSEEIVSRFDIMDEEGRPISSEHLPGARVLRGEPDSEALIQWRDRASRETHCAIVKATAIRDESGRLRHVVDIFHDVTARRSLEEQVRQAQKMEAVGRLAGGIAHDFNNLLTVINGYSEMLLDDLPLSEARREAATAIREAGQRATQLTGQLLAFSRKAIVAPRVLDLNDVVSSMGKLLRRLIGEDVLLATSLAPRLDRVKVDPGQIEQVIMNLAVNARDAMPAGGRLTIETANFELRQDDGCYPELPPGRYVRLAVSDTGHGMTDTVKARVFEPFFTTKEQGKGTGLGLATVHGIVKTHSGHITLYTEVGLGTTFAILFPSESEVADHSSDDRLSTAPPGTETVLLVEDDDAVRRFARLALAAQGYTVLEAANGTEAMQAARLHAGPIHLLLTDVVMPDQGGRQVADAVRTCRPGIKVLYMSGYTDDAVVRHGILEASDAFLQKPFTPLMLAQEVRAVLEESWLPGRGE